MLLLLPPPPLMMPMLLIIIITRVPVKREDEFTVRLSLYQFKCLNRFVVKKKGAVDGVCRLAKDHKLKLPISSSPTSMLSLPLGCISGSSVKVPQRA